MQAAESLPGGLGAHDLPRCFGAQHEAKSLWALVEPGGIVFGAHMEPALWVA